MSFARAEFGFYKPNVKDISYEKIQKFIKKNNNPVAVDFNTEEELQKQNVEVEELKTKIKKLQEQTTQEREQYTKALTQLQNMYNVVLEGVMKQSGDGEGETEDQGEGEVEKKRTTQLKGTQLY